jgi:hypothetical protein
LFHLQDIHLHSGHGGINHLCCPLEDLNPASFVCLEFTNQKNGVQGGLIELGQSGTPAFYPVQACINRIHHLRLYHAPPNLPLYAFFSGTWYGITTSILTTELWHSANLLGHTMGISAMDISVCSSRSTGAMALLCGNIDTDHICLLGRWWSNEMLCYLHVQAYPIVTHLAPAMLQHGHYTLLPNTHRQQPQPRLPPPTTGTWGS